MTEVKPDIFPMLVRKVLDPFYSRSTIDHLCGAMKTYTLAEIAARYNMTPRAFERLLERIGWDKAEERGFTVQGKVTPFGLGYIYQASRE